MSDPDGTAISPVFGPALAERCRDLTPDVLARLGLPARVVRWEADDRDTFDTEWTGARLGPTTTARRRAVLLPDDDSEAEVTLTTIRWSPDDVAFVEVSASWRVGDARASVWARGTKSAPIEGAAIRGDHGADTVIRSALGAG